ncbi:type I restriction enzyme, S subunit [Atopostipes suicloacalis DSM 15692]|uniref:Type I restriction enzyme, S subunit n=1 Tax=Atopostipes suicloacalis DSM 15692 TaxID=1121025 RepID=A0A1M4WK08_9LACT|nr:restriction endonuclease subunit S [Atopostipes suicloacalis]SHE81413.1 type I restriction enzyme, S subunit [Atopostipes suicloacalis DSM 15692]
MFKVTITWMQCELANLIELLRSYPLSRKYETHRNSGFRYIHYGDIHTGIANVINEENNLPCILEGKYRTLKKDDIILADASEDYQGIAWPAVLNINPDENIVAGLHTIALRPKANIDSLFMYYTFLTTDFRKFGYRMGTGMKVFGITSNNLLKYNFNMPSKIDEQIKIRSIIDFINNVITLEQEKLNLILKMKHVFLRKVYSTKANDNMVLCKLNNYISKKGKINKENKEYIVSSVNNKKGFINQSEQFESTRLNNLDKSTYRIIEPKDFAYNPSRINVGSIGYNDTDNILIVSPLYIVFRLNDEINDRYFYYYTQTEKFLYEVNRNTEGSVRQSLTFENMGNINIPIPNNYQTQLLISQYFKKIDNIIFITEQKINRCKKIKTYLLQSLFV